VESEEEAARVILALRETAPGCGLVISNPLPKSEQLAPSLHDRALRAGLEGLERDGVRGKEVTPYLLERFREETGGKSLEVNKVIIRRNVRLAARIAVTLAKLEGEATRA
jgi:pseudouridine-5'-phosphate glycosidase